jgi:hypothetical protein
MEFLFPLPPPQPVFPQPMHIQVSFAFAMFSPSCQKGEGAVLMLLPLLGCLTTPFPLLPPSPRDTLPQAGKGILPLPLLPLLPAVRCVSPGITKFQFPTNLHQGCCTCGCCQSANEWGFAHMPQSHYPHPHNPCLQNYRQRRSGIGLYHADPACS